MAAIRLARLNAGPRGRRDRRQIYGFSWRPGDAAAKRASAVVLVALILVAGGCNRRDERPPESQFRPTATIKDIMTSIIDPEADVLWNAVATIVSLSGTEEREPKTDEEWAAVRQSAVQLVEATNLLRVPGRHVAKPGEKSENPRIELQPETIQRMIAEDPARWSTLVDRLHDAAVPALRAVEAKNAKGLFDAGEHIEHACEACHQQYWYPPKEASAWKHEPGGRIDDSAAAPVQTSKGGTISGHVAAKGKVPGNPVIRMGMDPKCATLNAGKSTVQEIVAAGADGSLANVFVSLQGAFPGSPVPAEPVTIDQRGCVYVPRVVGAQVGQTVQVRNSDELLHNVHSNSTRGNAFNFSQPRAGIVQEVRLKEPETMLRVACDVHRWMTAFVGVVSHPYFATSGVGGTFTIVNVPAGTHTIQAWHELFGVVTQTVRVTDGATSTVEFAYVGK
jgi:plastocyanin